MVGIIRYYILFTRYKLLIIYDLNEGNKNSPYLEYIPDKFKIVAGVKVDLDTSSRVSYGKLVCIMNNNDQLLCINVLNEVCVKHIDDISINDTVSFKLIDLDHPDNLKNVKIGSFIWLQV